MLSLVSFGTLLSAAAFKLSPEAVEALKSVPAALAKQPETARRRLAACDGVDMTSLLSLGSMGSDPSFAQIKPLCEGTLIDCLVELMGGAMDATAVKAMKDGCALISACDMNTLTTFEAVGASGSPTNAQTTTICSDCTCKAAIASSSFCTSDATCTSVMNDCNTIKDCSGDGDDPCFGRDESTACLITEPSLAPADAFSQCFGGAAAEGARRVMMADLVAGDLVLSGAESASRVVVNQHLAEADKSAALLRIVHSDGELTATPDHVVLVGGEFTAARFVAKGSTLGESSTVTAVHHLRGGIINPVTQSGTILAAGVDGAPALAATAREGLADLGMSAYTSFSPAVGVASLFPATAQAAYNRVFEPFFNQHIGGLIAFKAAAPAPLVAAVVVAGDAALVTGFAAYALGASGLAVLAALGLASRALRAK